ncbi:MAG: transposase [Methylicorpusculum sp.]|uniref:IS110 family transposase n=1 Tax=Methylicorpusculum sp. TaxID=2713644 RepID=UPI002718B0F1|nr:transposase [Methylicorpusculum sp.]MDO9240003.1 transposase [Methylicorpusculum sp.]MDP2202863.1 transposase [Methylicorpusculum sp.]
MKKHSYRQTDLNKIDWINLREKTAGQDLLFSVDVAKQDFVGVLMTQTSEILKVIKWKHPQDTANLLECLSQGLRAKRLEVALEPSGTYGDVLVWQFKQRGVEVYRVSPKHVHDLAESFDGTPSLHDAKAAQIIADLHLRGRSALWQEVPEKQRDLRGMATELEVHQKLHQANLNRLSAQLARHWPELEYAADISRISVLSVIARYGAPDEVNRHEVEAEALLLEVGGHFLSEDKRHAIVGSAQDSLGVACSAGERLALKALATDLLRTHRASLDVEKRMAQAVQEDDALRHLAELCGTVSAIVLAAILGDLKNYANPGSLLKALGLNLKERSSGKHHGQLKITKRGSGRARFYLYWLVMRLVQKDAVIKVWYERKVARDGGRFKGRALIAVMRKVVKALWHVARGEVFDSRKLFHLA